jgi:hypothetical protein
MIHQRLVPKNGPMSRKHFLQMDHGCDGLNGPRQK